MILFNSDRYNLPLCLILSFFGGWAVSAIWRAGGGRYKAAKAAALGLVFAYGLLYSASVDALMVSDARYEAERWIKQNISEEAVIGRACPLEYAPRLNGYNSLSLQLSLDDFRKRQPDYVILAPAYVHAFPSNSLEREFFSGFATEGGARHDLVFRSHTARPWLLVRYRNSGTNIDAINVESLIYRRRPGGFEKRSP